MRIQKLLPIASRHAPAELERELGAWFQGPAGQRILAAEAQVLRAVIPRLFGYYCIHAGPVFLPEILDDCIIKRHFRLVTALQAGMAPAPSHEVKEPSHAWFAEDSNAAKYRDPAQLSTDVSERVLSRSPSRCIGRMDALPFDSNSVDAILMHHCLDVDVNPHSALREACRVLVPGGSIVLVGFNPWSLWGMWRTLTFRAGFGRFPAPWGCRFVSPYRLSDWLNLLDFEVQGCETRFYLPLLGGGEPGENTVLARVQSFAEQHFHHFGATYIMVAKKREVGMMPLKAPWQARKPAFNPPVVAHARESSVATVASLVEAKRKRDEDRH